MLEKLSLYFFGLFFLLIILTNPFRLPFTCTCTKVCLFSSTPNLIPFQFFLFSFSFSFTNVILVWWIRYRQLVLKAGPQFQPPYTYGQAGQNNSTNKNATGTYVPICILLDYCLHAKVSWHENWALQLAWQTLTFCLFSHAGPYQLAVCLLPCPWWVNVIYIYLTYGGGWRSIHVWAS